MADSHADHAHDYVSGEMDISAHKQMYSLFVKMVKWGSLGVSALILFLTLWFAVGTGFIAATIATVVLTVAGIVMLRDGKAAAH